MKCSKCGKEFGGGSHCQYCGIDRVAGLGCYQGYDVGYKQGGAYESNTGAGSPASLNSRSQQTICWSCQEVIPDGLTYCPSCGTKLKVECPKCGHTYSARFPICGNCGTNRLEYLKSQEEQRQKELKEQQRRQEEQRRLERAKRDVQIAQEASRKKTENADFLAIRSIVNRNKNYWRKVYKDAVQQETNQKQKQEKAKCKYNIYSCILGIYFLFGFMFGTLGLVGVSEVFDKGWCIFFVISSIISFISIFVIYDALTNPDNVSKVNAENIICNKVLQALGRSTTIRKHDIFLVVKTECNL